MLADAICAVRRISNPNAVSMAGVKYKSDAILRKMSPITNCNRNCYKGYMP